MDERYKRELIARIVAIEAVVDEYKEMFEHYRQTAKEIVDNFTADDVDHFLKVMEDHKCSPMEVLQEVAGVITCPYCGDQMYLWSGNTYVCPTCDFELEEYTIENKP